MPVAYFITAASLTEDGNDAVDGVPIYKDSWLAKKPGRPRQAELSQQRYALPVALPRRRPQGDDAGAAAPGGLLRRRPRPDEDEPLRQALRHARDRRVARATAATGTPSASGRAGCRRCCSGTRRRRLSESEVPRSTASSVLLRRARFGPFDDGQASIRESRERWGQQPKGGVMPHSPTEVLREEHELVLMVVAAMEREVASIERDDHVNADRVANMVDFTRNFTDGCHHAKEERVLFPLLEQRDAAAGGPVSVMLSEHDAGRHGGGAITARYPASRRTRRRARSWPRTSACTRSSCDSTSTRRTTCSSRSPTACWATSTSGAWRTSSSASKRRRRVRACTSATTRWRGRSRSPAPAATPEDQRDEHAAYDERLARRSRRRRPRSGTPGLCRRRSRARRESRRSGRTPPRGASEPRAPAWLGPRRPAP